MPEDIFDDEVDLTDVDIPAIKKVIFLLEEPGAPGDPSTADLAAELRKAINYPKEASHG